MNKMIYEEKRKAKKKRRLRFLLVAAVILILNAGIVLANDDLREKVGDYLYKETQCKPVILTVIQEV